MQRRFKSFPRFSGVAFVRSACVPGNPARVILIIATALAGAVPLACGETKLPLPSPTEIAVPPGPPPVLTSMLNAVNGRNSGLLTGVGSDGAPATSLPAADPTMTETLRFYDTVQTPFPSPVPVDYPDPFTGANTTVRMTAPMTLDAWKGTFGFSPREVNESLQSYRDRVGIAIYYNRNELGLGRELGCSRFVDGTNASGEAILGIACFVTNYGAGFRLGQASLQAAIDGTEIRNTVCITYRPTMDLGYQVQFYVYGPTGARQQWARLDTLGPRPHPHVCMTCHGGAYDDARHLAKNSHFLPLDPSLVVFAEGDATRTGLTRAAQEERIRVVNAMATDTPLTSPQQALLNSLYPNNVRSVGSVATGDGVPDAWKRRAADSDFYRGVVTPYCGTCHLAGQRGLGDSDLRAFSIFASPAAFDATALETHVCNSFSMPNAQPTSLGFWDADDASPVTVAGRTYPAAADALMARRGFDRSSCPGLSDVSGCKRGTDPDSLCGGNVSGGATCDLDSGRCVPTAIIAP